MRRSSASVRSCDFLRAKAAPFRTNELILPGTEYARMGYAVNYRIRCGPNGGGISLYPLMGPSNDHELEIAREVDKLSVREDLNQASVPEILAFLDFRVSS